MLNERDMMDEGSADGERHERLLAVGCRLSAKDQEPKAESRQPTAPWPLRTDELDYELPEHLIATRPVAGPRDSARMMVLSRSEPERPIEHRQVRDLPEYVRIGDVMVFNTSAVARARLSGYRVGSGGRVEGLFLEETSKRRNVETSKGRETSKPPNAQTSKGIRSEPRQLRGRAAEESFREGRKAPNFFDASASRRFDVSPSWLVMLKSNGRLRVGDRIALVDAHGEEAGVALELMGRSGADWIVNVDPAPASPEETIALLERVGRTPLPPYILRARGKRQDESCPTPAADLSDNLDRAWYETVYADPSLRKSVAAPTAGLHFTPELLARLDQRGVQRLKVVLHVGAGTFQPVKAQTLAEHRMHEEWYEVPAATVEALSAVRSQLSADGRHPIAASQRPRTFAIGTTAVRTLESLPSDLQSITGPITGTTDLMIAPGYEFKHVDGLLTNFHLPRSTLLALAGAMIGLDRLKAVYRVATEREYRFFSYGDCMLILP